MERALLATALPDLLALAPPAWILALVLAGLNVFVFHVLLAPDGRSPLYLAPFGLCGFSAGNLAAALLQSPLPMLGDVHVVEASAGTWLILSLLGARNRL